MVNYQCYGTFYWELLKGLKSSHPELHESFLHGNFVVKPKEGSFNAVAHDMGLEQSIKKISQKYKRYHRKLKESRLCNRVDWSSMKYWTSLIFSER